MERLANRETREELALKDEYLKNTIKYLRKRWFEKDVGLVAAAIVSGDKVVYATSTFDEETGKWNHAEKNAMDKFREYGVPGHQAFAVTTLSPCNAPSRTRNGVPCTNILLSNGITRVHFGYLDKKQTPSLDFFGEMSIVATETTDPKLRETSEALSNFLFAHYGKLRRFFDDEKGVFIRNTLNEIKMKTTTYPFPTEP